MVTRARNSGLVLDRCQRLRPGRRAEDDRVRGVPGRDRAHWKPVLPEHLAWPEYPHGRSHRIPAVAFHHQACRYSAAGAEPPVEPARLRGLPGAVEREAVGLSCPPGVIRRGERRCRCSGDRRRCPGGVPGLSAACPAWWASQQMDLG